MGTNSSKVCFKKSEYMCVLKFIMTTAAIYSLLDYFNLF